MLVVLIDSEDDLDIETESEGLFNNGKSFAKRTLAANNVVGGCGGTVETEGDFIKLLGIKNLDDLWGNTVGVNPDGGETNFSSIVDSLTDVR